MRERDAFNEYVVVERENPQRVMLFYEGHEAGIIWDLPLYVGKVVYVAVVEKVVDELH